ncbi:MAG: hypothetical protein ACO4AJ_02870, partial [Prochlorothrix sp.]
PPPPNPINQGALVLSHALVVESWDSLAPWRMAVISAAALILTGENSRGLSLQGSRRFRGDRVNGMGPQKSFKFLCRVGFAHPLLMLGYGNGQLG